MNETAEQLAAAIADGLRGDVRLLRRVFPTWHGDDGRPDSGNFKLDPDGSGTSMTVWLGPNDYAAVIGGHDNFGVVWISAEALFEQGLQIVSDPLEGDAHHVLVEGARNKRAERNIRDRAEWVRYPEPYKLPQPADLPDPLQWQDEL